MNTFFTSKTGKLHIEKPNSNGWSWCYHARKTGRKSEYKNPPLCQKCLDISGVAQTMLCDEGKPLHTAKRVAPVGSTEKYEAQSKWQAHRNTCPICGAAFRAGVEDGRKLAIALGGKQ